MYSPQRMKLLLLLGSLLSRLGSWVKDILYRCRVIKPERAPLPVISVGNISFGGSEKTPLAMHLVSYLLEHGYKPAFISRGYRGRWEKRGGIVSDGNELVGSWQDSGDEPYLAARSFPGTGVFVGKHRLLSCQRAKDLGFDLAVLDDGFQHRRLHRDLDIVLFDPRDRLALRESRSSLGRADIILRKRGAGYPEKEKTTAATTRIQSFSYSVINRGFQRLGGSESLPSDAFQGKKALAFCGIARPERFLALLKEAGIEVVSAITFLDHHAYPPSSLRKIIGRFQEQRPDCAITTEKDAVKLPFPGTPLAAFPVYSVKVGLEIDQGFYERVISCLTHLPFLD